mmetsp:Transcript_21236/g.59061  ORF Transcript_21236/g.59061 Transcript_21236/m.59061 type:complete len:212 (-) Transcript_21236:67-702(-)
MRHFPPHVRRCPQAQRRAPRKERRRSVHPRGPGRELSADERRKRVGRRRGQRRLLAARRTGAAAQGRRRGGTDAPTGRLDDLFRHHAGRGPRVAGRHAADLRPHQSHQDGDRLQLHLRAGNLRIHQHLDRSALGERLDALRKRPGRHGGTGHGDRSVGTVPRQGHGGTQGLEGKIARKHRLGNHLRPKDPRGRPCEGRILSSRELVRQSVG